MPERSKETKKPAEEKKNVGDRDEPGLLPSHSAGKQELGEQHEVGCERPLKKRIWSGRERWRFWVPQITTYTKAEVGKA